MRPGDRDLVLIRDLARRLVANEMPPPERDRTQRMLTEACSRVADRHGLDAQRLYWEAIHYSEVGVRT